MSPLSPRAVEVDSGMGVPQVNTGKVNSRVTRVPRYGVGGGGNAGVPESYESRAPVPPIVLVWLLWAKHRDHEAGQPRAATRCMDRLPPVRRLPAGIRWGGAGPVPAAERGAHQTVVG